MEESGVYVMSQKSCPFVVFHVTIIDIGYRLCKKTILAFYTLQGVLFI